MSTSVIFHVKLLHAVSFAAEKHINQRRKDANATPYINHPIGVADTLVTVAGITDLDVLQAAILHDVVGSCAFEKMSAIITHS